MYKGLQLQEVGDFGDENCLVPLNLIRGIMQHKDSTGATDYLFTGADFDSRYSQKGVQWFVKNLCRKAGIRKEVTTHTLRHTYATHLLEDGLDIVSMKELLGHANIETTMVYLHIPKTGRMAPFCPMDNLYTF